MLKDKHIRKDRLVFVVFALLAVILILLPTGFTKQLYRNAEGVSARVVDTDDSRLYFTGIIMQGEQTARLHILSGRHKGSEVHGVNLMAGSVERDKQFKPGDRAYVIVEQDDAGRVTFATMVDYDRLGVEIFFAVGFGLLLLTFSGWRGLRTILGVVVTFLLIWKVLIPGMLKGMPPLLLALIVGNAITLVILLLVTGYSKITFISLIASLASSLATGVLAILMTGVFNLNGSVMIDAEGLLHAGFQHLNLTAILQAGMYLACSGAVMDMSVDISAALQEIADKAPHVTRRELLRSGLRIGRAVVGTQTITLILAYIGNYLSIMMVYMAQGTGYHAILTSRHIAAEILATLVGCVGIVIVSPLTSLIGAYVLKDKHLLHAQSTDTVSPPADGVYLPNEPERA